MDWIADNPWVVFLAIAVALAVIEMMSLDLVLLMFAIGAAAASIASGVGAPLWAAIAVFAVVSLLMLFVARPPLVERLHAGPTLVQGHDANVGRTAEVVEPVDHNDGRIRLAGEVWSARADDHNARFDIDTEVKVVRIEGATAVVSAVNVSTDTETEKA